MPAAVAIPAIIGAAGSVGGALIQRSAAKSAAETQQQNAEQVAENARAAAEKAATGVDTATTSANGFLQNVFDLQSGNLAPYLQAGQQGLTTLMDMLKPGGFLTQQFTAPTAEQAAQTPGFQFQMDQAMQALQRSKAASGTLQSGGALKALTRYGQNVASTYYQNAFNNALNTFQTNRNNALSGLTTLGNFGQFGTSQYNAAAQNYGNLSANNLLNAAIYRGNTGMNAEQLAAQALTGGANAVAAGQVASGNAWNNMIGGLANTGIWAATQGFKGQPYTPASDATVNWFQNPTSTYMYTGSDIADIMKSHIPSGDVNAGSGGAPLNSFLPPSNSNFQLWPGWPIPQPYAMY